MPYIPHSETDKKEMLETIGIKNIDFLFKSIPQKYRITDSPFLKKEGLCEYDAKQKVEKCASINKVYATSNCFLGAGSYYHYIPSAVDHIVSRSEFYTAYTPYQPEISQGTLQSIFEFQTYMCKLTGMDVSNASMYDGATALAEAVLVAFRYGREKKNNVLVPENLHPEYLEILNKHLKPFGIKTTILTCSKNGTIDLEDIKKHTDNILAVIVQSPNYFGLIEEQANKITEYAKQKNIISIFMCIEPSSLGLFKSPAELGFDLAVLELQSLGTPVSFGGPHIGVITCKNEYVRNMPGRIIGETVDTNGNRCYVLTLATREQHIRREKATSNICSNQGLVALRTAIYLTLLGSSGFANLSKINYSLSHYAYQLLSKLNGISARYGDNFYNEFIIDFKSTTIRNKVVEGLKSKGFLPGLSYQENSLLICITELNNKCSIDAYVSAVKELLN